MDGLQGRLFLYVIIVLSAIIHEYAHAWAAAREGDLTAKYAGRLTLNPLAHLDWFGFAAMLLLGFGWAKPVPFNPYNLSAGKWGPALVGLAGPLSNLLIVGVFALILRSAPWLSLSGSFLELVTLIILVNLWLAAFNLIPVPPLDGSKILFALIPYRWRKIEQIMEQYQLVLILLAILFISNLVSPVVMFIFKLLTGAGI